MPWEYTVGQSLPVAAQVPLASPVLIRVIAPTGSGHFALSFAA